jgi:hypothetical protein
MSLFSTKHKAHTKFHIVLNDPPGGQAFIEGSAISGESVLLSSHDEDVGDVFVTFQGLLKTHLHQYPTDPYNSGARTANYISTATLVSQTKTIYTGGPKLPKNVTYKWPFEFKLPSGLLPSGTFRAVGGRTSGTASITYELRAVRLRTKTSREAFEKALALQHDMPFQPFKIIDKFGPYTGCVATADFAVKQLPARSLDYNLQSRKSYHQIQVPLLRSLHGLPEMHDSQQHRFDSSFSVEVELPKTLIQGSTFPVLIGLKSTVPEIPPASLQTISAKLITMTTIRTDDGHFATGEFNIPLLAVSDMELPLRPNCNINLQNVLQYRFEAEVVRNLAHPLLVVQYCLEVEVRICCGQKDFKDNFIVEDIDIVT